MHTWSEKDLDSIARKMKNVERRLDLSRGGPKTQKIQKEIVARLDEMIKDLENKNKGNGC
jgi:polyhydroxyalkanoate synthesis regulator phasin